MHILDPWKAKGYQFDERLNLSAGKVKFNNRCLCFFSEATPQRAIALTRLTIQAYLGRKLRTQELIRFKGKNKKDQRKSNLIFHSRTATAREFYEVNGPPILGYSHCMCRCGEALDVEKQKDQPHAFVVGHSPADKRRSETLEASWDDTGAKKKTRKPRTKKVVIPKPDRLAVNPFDDIDKEYDLAMQPYRPLFEKMIHQLPWMEFKEHLHLLLKNHVNGKAQT